MNPTDLSIVAADSYIDDATPAVVVKISTSSYELNVWLTLDEVVELPRVKVASWESGGAIKLGQCAAAPAFWSATDDHINILVGHDDQTWDVGVWLPRSALDAIISEINTQCLVSVP